MKKKMWEAGLLATLLAVFPFVPPFAFLYGSATTQYIAILLVVSVLAIGTAWHVWKRREVCLSRKSPLLITLSLVALIYIVAAVLGVHATHSFFSDSVHSAGIWLFLHLGVLALITAARFGEDDWSLVRRGLVCGAALYGALTFVGASGLGFSGMLLGYDFSAADPFFGNATYAGMYLMLAVIFGLVEFTRTVNVRMRKLLMGALACIALSPVLFNWGLLFGRGGENTSLLGHTRASGTVFVILAVFLMGWWLLRKIPYERVRRFAKLGWAGAAIGASLIGSILLLTPNSVVQQAYLDDTTIARFTVWESVMPAIAERPLLGYGPENFYAAHDPNINPSLYEESGRIVWFDRAHNIVLDTLVEVGVIGTLAILALIGAYAFVMIRAWRKKRIGEFELVLWLALPVVHFVQLQTAFNVIPTYLLLTLALGYALYLDRLESAPIRLRETVAKGVAAVLAVAALGSLVVVVAVDLPRLAALTESLSERNMQTRAELIELGLSRTSDYEALHAGSKLFVASVFDAARAGGGLDAYATARPYLAQYLAAYERYLETDPTRYGALVNYAYLLMLERQWQGENRLDEVIALIERAEAASPENPLTDIIRVMAGVYSGNLEESRAALAELKAAAPSLEDTARTESWLSRQDGEGTPRSFLYIENL